MRVCGDKRKLAMPSEACWVLLFMRAAGAKSPSLALGSIRGRNAAPHKFAGERLAPQERG